MKLNVAALATAAVEDVFRKSRRLASLRGVVLLISEIKDGTLRLRLAKWAAAQQKKADCISPPFLQNILAYLIAEKSVPERNSFSIFFTNRPSLVEAL